MHRRHWMLHSAGIAVFYGTVSADVSVLVDAYN